MDRKRIWKERTEKITNEENDWDQVTNAEIIRPEKRIFHVEIINAMKAVKTEKAAGLYEVNFLNDTCKWLSWEEVMRELYQRMLDGKSMPNDWKPNVVVPFYKGKGGVLNCGSQKYEIARSWHENCWEFWKKIRSIVD